MKNYQVKRLLKLAEYLRTVKRSKFDIEVWGDYKIDSEGWTINKYINEQELVNKCGTVGCAMGWACTIPEFRRAGLKLKNGNVCYKDKDDGFGSAEDFFGITSDEALILFSSGNGYPGIPSNKITPIMVSNRIKTFLKQKGELV